MAATKYNIFVRYMNNNKTIVEQTQVDWMSYMEHAELEEFYQRNGSAYNSLINQLSNGTKKKEMFTVEELEIYTKVRRYLEFNEKLVKGTAVMETIKIEPYDFLYSTSPAGHRALKEAKSSRDNENQKILSDEAKASNPKFEMIFMYDGLGQFRDTVGFLNPPPDSDVYKMKSYVYFDNMKRVQQNPWFLYTQYASLKAAMLKAGELVNIMGPESVLIGKEVALDQYIDIV